ncbi:MAG: glycerol dehydrogenase [Clostridia bacterium]|nr:glycerol dehydrogenase [Clostridia bacterium]
MLRVLRVPPKFILGRDALCELRQRCAVGKNYLVIGGKRALAQTKPKIEKSFEGAEETVMFHQFSGLCSYEEVARTEKLIEDNKIDVIVGVGGGNALDTARAAGTNKGIYVVMAPTVAATDAPCTSISMYYKEDGTGIAGYSYFHKNPDMVIVDSDIVAKAPVRYFISGMGDAIATYFEGRTCYEQNVPTFSKGTISKTGLALARMCYENLMETGYLALQAAKKGVVTSTFEDCLESTVYLSGVGGEQTGVAGAHGFGNWFAAFPEAHDYWHGEKVAVGLVIQLVMENAPELEEVLDFLNMVGLPTMLSDIGITDIEAGAAKMAKLVDMNPNSSVKYTKGDTSYQAVYDAIIAAQEIAAEFKAGF